MDDPLFEFSLKTYLGPFPEQLSLRPVSIFRKSSTDLARPEMFKQKYFNAKFKLNDQYFKGKNAQAYCFVFSIDAT